MISWYWLIPAFIIGSIVTEIASWCFDLDEIWVNVLATICFPFVWLAQFPITFLKNYICPVPKERVDMLLKSCSSPLSAYHISGDTLICHDPDASRIQAKWFLVKVKAEEGK